MTKKRNRIICGAIAAFALMAISAIAIWFLFGRGASASAAASRLNVSEAEAAVDRIYSSASPNRSNGFVSYSTPAIPPELKRASPKSIRVTDKGVYLRINEFFVEEDGIFILKSETDFKPSGAGDPSYKKVSGRVYTYHISG
jgi:hypothetical protein